MGTAKRERQKAGRQARVEQAKVRQTRRQRFKLIRNLAILAAVVIGLLFVLSSGDDDEGDDDVATDASTSTTGEVDTETPSTVDVTLPAAGASVAGETQCPPADGSAPRTTTFEQLPPMCIDPAKTYTARFVTTEGDFTVELDDEAAPQTVNNFVVLARYHYYDGVAFHRIIPGFMNQAGDPNGPEPGQGDPGYSIPDELPTGDAPYPEGTLAMANTGQPNSGGSQFFITVENGGEQLTPTYTAFGTVTSGLEVLRTINQFGDAPSNGKPTKDILIETVTVEEA